MDRQTLEKILNAAGEERFKQKAMHFQAEVLNPALRALSVGEAAGQVLYRGMMRALGYSQKHEAFSRPCRQNAALLPSNPERDWP